MITIANNNDFCNFTAAVDYFVTDYIGLVAPKNTFMSCFKIQICFTIKMFALNRLSINITFLINLSYHRWRYRKIWRNKKINSNSCLYLKQILFTRLRYV